MVTGFCGTFHVLMESAAFGEMAPAFPESLARCRDNMKNGGLKLLTQNRRPSKTQCEFTRLDPYLDL